MGRKIAAVVALVVVAVAVVFVTLAATSPSGLASALGMWGFVVGAIGAALAAIALWPSRTEPNVGAKVQVNHAERGDMYISQTGAVNVDNHPGPPGRHGSL